MTILPDWQIRYYAERHKMIDPFVPEQVRAGVISYGLSSFGYDLRAADTWRWPASSELFNPNQVIDPKRIDEATWLTIEAPYFDIPPHGFVLCRALEYLRMPADVMGIVMGKSTYARCGLIVNCTPLEPGWHGHLAIELSNSGNRPLRVYANEGIGQVYFLQGPAPAISYESKGSGKYQGQQGVVLARVEH
jgi:dCTP deaminase